MEISSITCYGGFLKSISFLPNEQESLKAFSLIAQEKNKQVTAMVEANATCIINSGYIQEQVPIGLFLNLVEGQVDDLEIDMMKHLIAFYQVVDEKDTEETVEPVKITNQDALDSITKLISWEEQQQEDSSSTIHALHRLQCQIITKKHLGQQRQVQTSIAE